MVTKEDEQGIEEEEFEEEIEDVLSEPERKEAEKIANNLSDNSEWIEKPIERLPSIIGDYEVEMFLSTDGKHTVRVKVVDPASRREAIEKATGLYDYIKERYGTKQAQAVREYKEQIVDPATCEHLSVGFFQVKKEGPNQGKWFKSCKICKKFLGFKS